jgi:hypothetical protein
LLFLAADFQVRVPQPVDLALVVAMDHEGDCMVEGIERSCLHRLIRLAREGEVHHLEAAFGAGGRVSMVTLSIRESGRSET